VQRPTYEVADVIRAHCDESGKLCGELGFGAAVTRMLERLAACRTARLGGHVCVCTSCGCEHPSYNSCRDRHCPKCQATKRAKWLLKREKELLPTHYFHVVFTLPEELAPLCIANKRLLYELLFRASAETLKQVAADEKRLGADIGFLSVLHTWGQTLRHHPHIHCVVPGGGLSFDGTKWRACRENFFLPVRVLSKVFRAKFLDGMRALYREGKLRLPKKLEALNDAQTFADFISARYEQAFVVYAKPPFGGPEVVLKYLARYTHRVAIANSRIVGIDERGVTFRYKDYAKGGVQRTMTLSSEAFLRRFALHHLPKGFVRIRQYGLLANRARSKLGRCRELLEQAGHRMPSTETKEVETDVTPRCPRCGAELVRGASFEPQATWTYAPTPRARDTS
jgi:hypothetical protein